MRRRMRGLGGFAAGDGDLRGHVSDSSTKRRPKNAAEARKKIRPIDVGLAAKMVARVLSDDDDRSEEGLKSLITERDLARAIKNNTLIEAKARAAAAKAGKSGKKQSTALDLELASQLGLGNMESEFGADGDDGPESIGGGGEGNGRDTGEDAFDFDDFDFGEIGVSGQGKSSNARKKT